MMRYNPSKRITAEEALNNEWIERYSDPSKVEIETMLESTRNLQKFQAISELHKAVLSYMTEHFMSFEREKKVREVFANFDTNHDGQLSKAELIKGYTVLIGSEEEAKVRVESIMEQLDMNKNGTIDYKEFLVANFEKEKMTNQNALKQAFDFFDIVLLVVRIG
jgi:calcium-dependent protein kinase